MFVLSRPIQPNLMVGGKAKILPLSVKPERNPHIHNFTLVKRVMTLSDIKNLDLRNVCNKLGCYQPSRVFVVDDINLVWRSRKVQTHS